MRYFDYASTTPLDPEIRQKYQEYLTDYFANSESMHPLGTEVKKLVDQSKDLTAKLLKVKPEEIIFTSGASEANSTAIKGYALANRTKGNHLITTQIEHSSVLNSYRQLEKEFGFRVTYLNVDDKGVVDLEQLKESIDPQTILVSIMAVNNESGTIEPLNEVKKILKDKPKIKLHVDYVQAVGKMPIDLTQVDFGSFAAHKIGGLNGCGVLYKKAGLKILPLISGGQQEGGLRGGTENALNYALFGLTLKKALDSREAHNLKVKQLNKELRNQLDYPGILINTPLDGSPYILNISCLKLPSEVHLNALGKEGFCVSAHSTCDSKSKDSSYVLKAMGMKGERLKGVIRISLAASLSQEDITALADAIKENIKTYGIH